MKKIVFILSLLIGVCSKAQNINAVCENDNGNNSTYNFGTVPVGISSTVTCTLTNFSEITGKWYLGKFDPNDNGFSVIQSECFGVDVPPNGTCTIVVQFSPVYTGYVNSIFSVGLDDGIPAAGMNATIEFIGYGGNPVPLEPPNCPLRLSKSNLTLDDLTLHQSLPIRGANFALNYSSKFGSTAIHSNALSFFNQDSGWGLSTVHYLNVAESRIQRGDGDSYPVTFETLPNGDLMVVDGEIYFFNSNGRHLQSKSSLTGVVTQDITYDIIGRIISIKDSFLNETILSRDSSGKLVAIVSPYGESTILTYNAEGLLSSIQNPNLEITRFEYIPNTAYLAKVTLPSGRYTDFEYDSNGLLKKSLQNGISGVLLNRTAGNSSATISALSTLGRQSTFAMARDLVTGAYVRQETSPSGFQTKYTELSNDSYKFSTDLGSQTLVTSNDSRFGALTSRISSIHRSIGNRAQNIEIQQILSGGTLNPFVFGSLQQKVTTNGLSSMSTFNLATKTFTDISPGGTVVTRVLNNHEQIKEIRTNNDDPLKFEYDSRGRLISLQNGSKPAFTLTYNSNGNIERTVNPRGEEFSYTYDLLGRVKSITNPNLKTTLFSYDADGNQTSLTPADRLAHLMKFNALNLLSSYEPPEILSPIKSTFYFYNDDKQLTSVRKPGYPQVTLRYGSSNGQLSEVSDNKKKLQIRYTSGDRLASITSFDGVTSSFDYLGKFAVSEKQIFPNNTLDNSGTDFKLGKSFLPEMKIVTADFLSSPFVTKYRYSADNQITKVQDMSLQYEAGTGRLSSTTLGNISDSRAYGSSGELSLYEAKFQSGSANSNLYSYSLRRDLAGRIVGLDENILGEQTSIDYIYDSLGQLIRVKKNNVISEEYQYDGNGNRVSSLNRGVLVSAIFDSQDRIVTSGSTAYVSNPNGDIISIDSPLFPSKIISWDSLGRLKGVLGRGRKDINYILDWMGRRIGKAVNGRLIERNIFESGSRISVSFSKDSRKAKMFYYGTNINSPDFMSYEGKIFRIIKNHLGSPRLVVRTSDGAVVQRLDYGTWGELLTDSNPGFQPYGFAGGLYEPDSELVHFEARDYDPKIARWISKDPILFDGGDTNLYGYTFSDPINFIDPNGLRTEIQCRSVVGTAGAASHCSLLITPEEGSTLGRKPITLSVLAKDGMGFFPGATGVKGINDPRDSSSYYRGQVGQALCGRSADDLDKEILRQFNALTPGIYSNNPFLDGGINNSNSFVYRVIRAAGGIAPSNLPGNAVGF